MAKRVHIHVHERKARDAMTFIEVLNSTEGRALVDAIEDTLNSLRAHGGKDDTLERILKNQIAELKRKTGFTYQVSDGKVRAEGHTYIVDPGLELVEVKAGTTFLGRKYLVPTVLTVSSGYADLLTGRGDGRRLKMEPVSDEATAVYKSHGLTESGGKWRITTPGLRGDYGDFPSLEAAKRKIDELIATGYPKEPTRDAEAMREGMNMTATIGGRRVKVRIIGIDSDPRVNVWVVEIADPDKGHFVKREQLTRDAAATGKDYLWNVAVMMAKEGQTQAYLEAYLKADKKLKPADIAYAVQVFNERKPIEELNRRNGYYDASGLTTDAAEPRTMTASQINAELDRLEAEGSRLNDQLIEAGRGSEKYPQIVAKSDPLSVKVRENLRRAEALRDEIAERYGSRTNRLPSKGFGPRTA